LNAKWLSKQEKQEELKMLKVLKKCRYHRWNKYSLYSVQKDVAETLVPKQFKSMRKFVKKYFKRKERYLMLQLKEHLKYRISRHLHQLILLHSKQNRKNQKKQPKFQNGNYKVKHLELD
jgi:hypothetical protein